VIAALLLLPVAACGLPYADPGFIGRRLDHGPTPAPVTETGGAHGALLSGGTEPVLSATAADRAVGPELARWMKPAERRALAEASQHAAVAERNSKLDWSSAAAPAVPDAAVGASGWVMPVSDPYRSQHGVICRDLRQELNRPDQPLMQAVSLCREEMPGGVAVWTLPHFP
jgi:hypothetical protein